VFFPRGPRGWLLQRLGSRAIERGVEDALGRFKKHAEATLEG